MSEKMNIEVTYTQTRKETHAVCVEIDMDDFNKWADNQLPTPKLLKEYLEASGPDWVDGARYKNHRFVAIATDGDEITIEHVTNNYSKTVLSA